jgi:hypothetical protein
MSADGIGEVKGGLVGVAMGLMRRVSPNYQHEGNGGLGGVCWFDGYR